ncbi:MAG: hypothetical protein HY094_10065 [Candidatus Melainabacteria bacterium]|nr:hypothetical protein [Candidatus Melainabacteria bacterium]
MLLEINFTLILFALSFLVFIYLLNQTLYKPVGNIIEKRKDAIDGDFSKAKSLSEAANELLENYKSEIKSARIEAHDIIQEAIAQAQKTKEEKVAVLTASLVKEKEAAIKQIKEEEKAALKQLEGQIKILTDLITSKILGSGEKTLVGSH